MISEEVHSNVEERPAIEPGKPLAELPPAVPADARETRPEVPPAVASTPPGGAGATRRQGMSPGGRWALSLGLTVLGGISWFLFGWGVAWGSPLVAVVSAAVPALTCLVAGWLLRSWWGLVAAVVVYVAVSALMWVLIGGGGPGGMAFLTVEFALYVALAGMLMAAVGTAIGMYRAGQATGHLA